MINSISSYINIVSALTAHSSQLTAHSSQHFYNLNLFIGIAKFLSRYLTFKFLLTILSTIIINTYKIGGINGL